MKPITRKIPSSSGKHADRILTYKDGKVVDCSCEGRYYAKRVNGVKPPCKHMIAESWRLAFVVIDNINSLAGVAQRGEDAMPARPMDNVGPQLYR